MTIAHAEISLGREGGRYICANKRSLYRSSAYWIMNTDTLPQYDCAYVVSDLHLGGQPGFQMFSEGEAFERFCTKIAKNVKATVPTLLVINGDFVDFLAEEGATYWNGDRASDDLRNLSTRDELRPVFDGLRKFVAKSGAKLVITLGNHDLELTLPDVRTTLLDILTDGYSNRLSRIEFSFDGWGYRFVVGDRVALATHGNEIDEYNFTRYDILGQISREMTLFGSSELATHWKPNAGTVFVIDAINQIKNEYPFIDMLKPEKTVAFLTLTILAPINLGVADEVARLKATAIANEFNRPSSERRFLGSGDTSPADLGDNLISQARARTLELKVSSYIHNASLDIDDLIYQDEDALLGIGDWLDSARTAIGEMIGAGVGLAKTTAGWVVDKATEKGKAAHSNALRTALRSFVSSAPFKVSTLDKENRELDNTFRSEYDVVFTGHTHTRRFARRTGGKDGHFVNTGTWAGLMRFTEKDVASASVFREVYDLMIQGDRQALLDSDWVQQERPVAVMKKAHSQVKLSLCRVADDGALESAGKHERVFKKKGPNT